MNGDVYVARRIAAAAIAAGLIGFAAALMGAPKGSVLLAVVGLVLFAIARGWTEKAVAA